MKTNSAPVTGHGHPRATAKCEMSSHRGGLPKLPQGTATRRRLPNVRNDRAAGAYPNVASARRRPAGINRSLKVGERQPQDMRLGKSVKIDPKDVVRVRELSRRINVIIGQGYSAIRALAALREKLMPWYLSMLPQIEEIRRFERNARRRQPRKGAR